MPDDHQSILEKFPNEKVLATAKIEEPRLVSLMLKNKALFSQAVERGLSPEHFASPYCRGIYSVMVRYREEHDGALLTRNSFESIAVRTFGDEEAAKYRSAFDSIYAEIVYDDDFSSLMDAIEDRWLQASFFGISTKYHGLILNSSAGQKELCQSMMEDINGVQFMGEGAFNRSFGLDDLLENDVMPSVMDRREHPEKYRGMLSGFKKIDKEFHGFRPSRYLVIIATEGGGKTTFMLNLARNFAMRGHGVAFVTIESPAADIAERLLTIHSAVNQNRIFEGGKDVETGLCDFIIKELSAAKDDMKTMMSKNLHIIQVLEGTSRKEICRLVEQIMAKHKIDAVFVDYLQVVGKEKSYPGRPDLELAHVSSMFRAWGRSRKVFTATAQQIKTERSKKLNEAGMKGTDNVQMYKSDVSGSKEISGAADHMLSLWVPPTKDKAVVFNLKNRQGIDASKCELAYDPNSGRMEDFPDRAGYDNIKKVVADPEMAKKLRKADAEAASAVEKDGMVKQDSRIGDQDTRGIMDYFFTAEFPAILPVSADRKPAEEQAVPEQKQPEPPPANDQKPVEAQEQRTP